MSEEPIPNLLDRYRSHKKKLLHVHTKGVTHRVLGRTTFKIAETAAIFHDLGKLNPNFQPKLDDKKVEGYSSHAYLSALAFLCFYAENKTIAEQQLGISSSADVLRVVALIARHHGNLPNFDQILNIKERGNLLSFVETNPCLPISDYLQLLLPHKPFDVLDPKYRRLLERCSGITLPILDSIGDKVATFQETQFAFSALIESDKRDAGDNSVERRKEMADDFFLRLSKRLPATEKPSRGLKLNAIRTAIRKEAVTAIRKALKASQGQERVYCLTAPTGAGKTRILLSLAKEILKYRFGDSVPFGVIYGLPFLSITEQVEQVCREILTEKKSPTSGVFSTDDFLLRFDSRAESRKLNDLQEEMDSDPASLNEFLKEEFAQRTFDYPFTITTFVQFFETLMSNRNSTLLKLPHFAHSIIILDEIQSLPPRLYTFFSAYLDAFCKRFDSYVLFSTATMPSLQIPDSENGKRAQTAFPEYSAPRQLARLDWYKEDDVFARYSINPCWEINSLEKLATKIRAENHSSMAILNTVPDTIALFDQFTSNQDTEYILLNTRFTPTDRRIKIQRCIDRLASGKQVVLITTQLVEAGVDIDFPVVYRDLCPLPNLIQAAGRCNRNNLPEKGIVYLFELRNSKGSSRAELIYGTRSGNPKWFLDFTRQEFHNSAYSESQLQELQRRFFDTVNQNLIIGEHPSLRTNPEDSNLLSCISEMAFEDAGKFRLIQEEGEQYAVYVPVNESDNAFALLARKAQEVAQAKAARLPFSETKVKDIALRTHLQKMSQRMVQARIKETERNQLCPEPPLFEIYRLGDLRNYSFEHGLHVSLESNFF